MESKTMKEDERIKKILKQRIVKIIENILNNKNVSEARGTLAEIRHCMVLIKHQPCGDIYMPLNLNK